MVVERYFVNQKNNNNITIGGVRSLSEFSPEQIIVNVPGATVCVTGEKLTIAVFAENEITINGKITDVSTTQTRKSL